MSRRSAGSKQLAQVALSLANLAALQRARGRVGAAEALLRRALSIREDALGPDHPMVCRPWPACHHLAAAAEGERTLSAIRVASGRADMHSMTVNTPWVAAKLTSLTSTPSSNACTLSAVLVSSDPACRWPAAMPR